MKTICMKIGLFLLAFGVTTSITAGDATTALFQRLHKGDCLPSSLAGTVWTITTGPVGAHGELNWGDRLVFEQAQSSKTIDWMGSFNAWKNGKPWVSATGWTGSCVRDGNLSLYVITGTVQLDGCLHELAFGRLDHDDTLGNRLEVIFEHAENRVACDEGHGDSVRHPGHTHGDKD